MAPSQKSRIFVYMNCRTKIADIKTKDLKKVTELTFAWCRTNLGRRKSGPTPTIKLSKKKFKDDPYYGEADGTGIVIYPHTFVEYDNCLRKFISIIIHEYTHTLQKGGMRKYHKLYAQYGYWNHPLEVEARESEKLWNVCYRDIKGGF